MSVLVITTQQELSLLVPYIPVMIDWLQEINPATAADVFFRVNEPVVGRHDLIVNFACQGLVKEIRKSPHGVSCSKLKLIFASYEIQVGYAHSSCSPVGVVW